MTPHIAIIVRPNQEEIRKKAGPLLSSKLFLYLAPRVKAIELF